MKGSRGYLPVAQYWLLRKHGEDIVQQRVNGSTLRTLVSFMETRFPASQSLLWEALKNLEKPAVAMAVAAKNWGALEVLLFGSAYPAFHQMERYKTYIAAENGYDLCLAHQELLFTVTASSDKEGRGEVQPSDSTASPAPEASEEAAKEEPVVTAAIVETKSKSAAASAFLSSVTASRARRAEQEVSG